MKQTAKRFVDNKKINFSLWDLILNKEFSSNTGAANEADLVLARGQGEFDINWDDPNEVSEVGKRFICKHHLEELSRNWDTARHIKTHTREKFCSMPTTLGVAHARKNVKTYSQPLNHEEAKAILRVTGTLLHEGIRKIL